MNSLRDTELYSQKLQCIETPIDLFGDYNSYKAKVLKITFEKCSNATRPEQDCYPDEVITEWLKRKFIIIL